MQVPFNKWVGENVMRCAGFKAVVLPVPPTIDHQPLVEYFGALDRFLKFIQRR